MRAPTLAEHVRFVIASSDRIARAVHAGDLETVEAVRDQLRQVLPPDGFDLADVLMVVLGAQIDLSVSVWQRLAWMESHPTLRELVAG